MNGSTYASASTDSNPVPVYFLFFFQAEDRIRDADVTGVQTCALPIFRARARTRVAAIARRPSFAPTLARARARRETEAGSDFAGGNCADIFAGNSPAH